MSVRKYRIVKLLFKGPLHLSSGKSDDYSEGNDIIRSDQFHAALYTCGVRLFGAAAAEEHLPGVTLSSAFPFVKDQNGKTEYLFPKPMLKLPLEFEGLHEEDESKKSKKAKKIAFLGKSVFEAVICGIRKSLRSDNLFEGGSVASEMKLSAGMIRSEVQQRVAIPLPGSGEVDAQPYYVERIFFPKDAGFFFIANCPSASDVFFDACLRLLGDEGIGTDRHVGNGNFIHDYDELEMQTPDKPDAQAALSLYCPLRDEIPEQALEKSSYALVKRGGFMAGAENPGQITYRKRSVYMFSEGSVFPYHETRTGKRVDLKPDLPATMSPVTHSVWRDGRAIFIPVSTATP